MLLVCIGIWYAAHRSDLADEGNSVQAVQESSYVDILMGKVKYQANSFPLFFLMFKPWVQNVDYHLWNRDGSYYIVCRLLSVFSVSFMISLIFYYMSNQFSLGWGMYSLFVSLTTFSIWNFFAIARPYPIWIVITGIQGLLIFHLLRKGYEKKVWIGLGCVHIALAMTHPFIIFYLATVSGALWLFVQKNWKKYLIMTFLPLAVWAFYAYQFEPNYRYGKFIFSQPSYDVVFANFSKERIIILFIVFISCLFLNQKSKFKNNQLIDQKLLKDGRANIILGAAMLLAVSIIIIFLKLRKGDPSPQDTPMFALHYITFLTAIGIITMTYGSYFLIHFFKNKAVRVLVIIMLLCINVWRGSIEWRHIKENMNIRHISEVVPFIRN